MHSEAAEYSAFAEQLKRDRSLSVRGPLDDQSEQLAHVADLFPAWPAKWALDTDGGAGGVGLT